MSEYECDALANLRLEVTHMGDEECVLDDLVIIERAIQQKATPDRSALSAHLRNVREALRKGDCIESVSSDFAALTNLMMSDPAAGAQILQDVTNKSNYAPSPVKRLTVPEARSNDDRLFSPTKSVQAKTAPARSAPKQPKRRASRGIFASQMKKADELPDDTFTPRSDFDKPDDVRPSSTFNSRSDRWKGQNTIYEECESKAKVLTYIEKRAEASQEHSVSCISFAASKAHRFEAPGSIYHRDGATDVLTYERTIGTPQLEGKGVVALAKQSQRFKGPDTHFKTVPPHTHTHTHTHTQNAAHKHTCTSTCAALRVGRVPDSRPPLPLSLSPTLPIPTSPVTDGCT